MEGLTNDEEDLIFEIELELLLIGTITLLEETVSLSSVGVSKIRSIQEYDQKQRTLDQTTKEVMLSTMKSKDFCVRPEVSLEDKVYRKIYYHHS
jgi:hypothetical protein